MSSSPETSSSDERKLPNVEVQPSVDVASGEALSEYDRYLVLHQTFQGARRQKLLRKLDARLLPTLILLYLMCSLDKSNASNAKLFGFLDDVGMTSTQFNLALMYFFFPFGLCEPLSNITLRRVGPKVWFPFIVTAWGLISALTCVVSSYAGYVAVRLALGAAEAGLYPGSWFVLSMWYTPRELGTRMAVFFGANTAAGAFGGVIAYAIGSLDGIYGWRAWRWLFLIEGLVTIVAGLSCLVLLPKFPHQYGKRESRWLEKDELEYAQLRVKFSAGPDAPTLEFRWSDVIAAAKDRKTYFMMMMVWWGGSVPTYSLSYTLPTMVENLGYTAVKAQALTAPPYIFATIVCILAGYLSDRHKRRYLFLLGAYALGLLGLVLLWASLPFPRLTGLSYAALHLAAAGYSAQSPLVGAWISGNVTNASKRAAATGLVMMIGTLGGGSIGANLYRAEQAPTYPLAFGVSVAATLFGAVLPATWHWAWMRGENRRRDRLNAGRLREMYSEEELADMGENSPFFRFNL